MMTPTVWASSMMPEFTSPTSITVSADEDWIAIVTVSYTHLDVYKRQPYVKTVDGEFSIEPANGADYVDRSKDFSHKIDHDDLCYKPVSYTHLDVYKRQVHCYGAKT